MEKNVNINKSVRTSSIVLYIAKTPRFVLLRNINKSPKYHKWFKLTFSVDL